MGVKRIAPARIGTTRNVFERDGLLTGVGRYVGKDPVSRIKMVQGDNEAAPSPGSVPTSGGGGSVPEFGFGVEDRSNFNFTGCTVPRESSGELKRGGVVETVVYLELLEEGVTSRAVEKRLVWEVGVDGTGRWDDTVKLLESGFGEGSLGIARSTDLFAGSPGVGVSERFKGTTINRWTAADVLFVPGQV